LTTCAGAGSALRVIFCCVDLSHEPADNLPIEARTMSVARIVLVAAVSLSLAVVPVIAGAAVIAKSAQMWTSDAGCMPTGGTDDCKNPAACALKCFNFSGAVVCDFLGMSRGRDVLNSRAEKAACPHVTGPPTRPPPA
jgi:hypothetical protein